MKKKILDGAFVLVSAVLILFSLIAWVPRLFGLHPYYVLTDSMKPTFSRGSLVYAKPVAFEDIHVGDILVFENAAYKKNFVHRVVRITNDQWIFTKGDANNVEDPLPAEYSCCRGIVKFHLPVVGFPAQFLHSTAGKVSIAVGYCLWAAAEVEHIRSHKKKKEVCA